MLTEPNIAAREGATVLASCNGRNGAAWLIALTGIWLWTWVHLSAEWRSNEQYQYCFAVPVLAAFMAWSRIRTPGLVFRAVLNNGWSKALYLSVGSGAWLIFLLGELLRQQDPAWRLSGGLMMLAASLLTIILLHRHGGFALIRQMAFPLAFAWLAMPWPSILSIFVTGKMLRVLTGVTVDILNWMGIAALQRGNLIELSNGLVGMETACSGVQSFQASLMASLFLGEFFRLNVLRRLVVVLGSGLIAMLGNLARILILTRLVAAQGQGAADSYHDRVGFAVTAGTFAGVLILAWLLSGPRKRNHPSTWQSSPLPGIGLRGRDGFLVLSSLLLAPLLTSIWFASVSDGKSDAGTKPVWALQTNQIRDGWIAHELELLPVERKVLRFSEGQGLDLRSPNGHSMQVFHFYWQAGDRMPSTVFAHTPDICMASAGWEQLGKPTPTIFEIKGMTIPGALFRFRQDKVKQAVFQSIWPPPFFGASYPVLDRWSQFALLWKAPRQRVHEVLLVYVPALEDPAAQSRAFTELLDQVLAPAGQR